MRVGSIDWRVGSRRTISATSSEFGDGSWAVDGKIGEAPSLALLEAGRSVSSDNNTISGWVGDGGADSEGCVEAKGASGMGLGAVGERATGLEVGGGGNDIIAS